MHQHECGIFDARSCHGHRRRPRCHHVQSGNDHAWWCKQPLWWGASCEVVDKFSEHVIAKQKRMHRRMDITSTNRIDASRATTSCRPRGPCIWYAFYDNVVLYLVCTYVARIAEPIGGPQPKGWEGGRGGKAQRTIHQMEGSGSKRSRRIAEPARNKTNNATSSSKKRIAAAPYIILDWPQLFTLAMTSILRCRLDHISTHKRRQMEGGKIATQ